MLDRLKDFNDLCLKKSIDRELTEAMFDRDPEAPDKHGDRELISSFLRDFQIALDNTNQIETNNVMMRKIFN